MGSDNVGDSEGLPRARGAQKNLDPVSTGQAIRQLGDRFGLIPLGVVRGFQVELGHGVF
jgi:hypothetical protein